MKRSVGTLWRVCAFASLAAMPRMAARGQATQPVTPVVPVASPAIIEASPSPAPPARAVSGTAPAVSGTIPSITGPAPSITGSARSLSGSGAAAIPSPPLLAPYSIEIDLGTQRAYLLKEGRKFAESPISSGRPGHLTPTGNFTVIQKDLDHFSNLYGEFVNKETGRVVKAGADTAMPLPNGCVFVPAPMKWFMRFDGAAGMHAGILPGYAASHGCIRMPAAKAGLFYNTVDIGTPVHIFGAAPPPRIYIEVEPHRKPASTPKLSPAPKSKHGWWF